MLYYTHVLCHLVCVCLFQPVGFITFTSKEAADIARHELQVGILFIKLIVHYYKVDKILFVFVH